MGYVVIFKRLAGIPNVALLVRPIVHIDYRRTAVGQKAVSESGTKLCNSIPMNIRNSNTIVKFKSHMYQHLLQSTNNHMGTNTNLSINIFFDLRQFLHTICCDKRCNTNQLGKITINVKLLAVLNNRQMYIFKLYIAITHTVQCSRSE